MVMHGKFRFARIGPIAAIGIGVTATWLAASAQTAPPEKGAAAPFVNPTHSMGKGAQEENALEQYSAANADLLLKVPVSRLHPGGVSLSPNMPNPVANDPDA